MPPEAIALVDGALSAGFHHARGTIARGAWCAWSFAALARAYIAIGETGPALALIDRLAALPVGPQGATGAVARWATREVLRLRGEAVTAGGLSGAGERHFEPEGAA